MNENKCGHNSVGSVPTRPLIILDNGISIKLLDSNENLGITTDSSFNPSMYCAQVFKRPHAALFLIRRSFATLTQTIFIPLYSTQVRPHLEYAIQASSPYLKKDFDHLERLQRIATRMGKGCRDLSYEERREKLNLFSLARRRLRGDLILAYNLSNGSFNLRMEEFFTQPLCSSLRGHILKLHHRRFRLNRRKAAFAVRIVEPWNKLPAFVIGSPTVDVLKSGLDACWTKWYPDVIE